MIRLTESECELFTVEMMQGKPDSVKGGSPTQEFNKLIYFSLKSSIFSDDTDIV